jgi:hypothetical protein
MNATDMRAIFTMCLSGKDSKMTQNHDSEGDRASKPNPSLGVPLRWVMPESISSRYSTEMRVQYSEHEFVLSFFETVPPAFFGTPAEQLEQARSLTAVDTVCVARVVISAKRMPAFAEAIETGLERYRNSFGAAAGNREADQ